MVEEHLAASVCQVTLDNTVTSNWTNVNRIHVVIMVSVRTGSMVTTAVVSVDLGEIIVRST